MKDFEKELNRVFINTVNVPQDTNQYLSSDQQSFDEYEEVMMMYSCAIKEVSTKVEVLNEELGLRRSDSPIAFIKSRLKSPESIAAKLERNGHEVSIESAIENLNDIAGIRIICSFIDDIYAIADMIAKQDDITVLQIKDYLKNPKPNGYRSLHLIVEIPVFFSDKKRILKAEIQIRTIAMDFWATLEHQLKYKKDIANSDQIVEELRECAIRISDTDEKMQQIRKKIVEGFRKA